MNKICSKCKIEKPLSEFVTRKNVPDGIMSICKVCDNIRKRKLCAEKARYCSFCNARILTSWRVGTCLKCKNIFNIVNTKLSILTIIKEIVFDEKITIEDKHGITDTYCKLIVARKTGISHSEIPKELVELKRAQIILYRALHNKS